MEKKKWIAVIVAGTLIAVLFGPNGPLGGFWGDTGDDDIPGGAMAGLVTAKLLESVAFGVGLAWLAFGWKVVRNVGRSLAVATYLAVGWALVSWAPHSSFHQTWTEDDWYGLAAIELGFHATLVIAAFVVAAYLWRTWQGSAPESIDRPATAMTA